MIPFISKPTLYVNLIILFTVAVMYPNRSLQAQEIEICAEFEELPIEQLWLSTLPTNAVLLDVRSLGEVKNGKLPNAKVNDVEGGRFKKDMEKMNLRFDQPLYVYCRTGRRSAQAVDSLLDMGYERVIWLKGGFTAWSNANRQIEN